MNFFHFYQVKKWFFCIFNQVNKLFLNQSYLKSLPPSQINLTKNLFFIIEKIQKYRKCPALEIILRNYIIIIERKNCGQVFCLNMPSCFLLCCFKVFYIHSYKICVYKQGEGKVGLEIILRNYIIIERKLCGEVFFCQIFVFSRN